MSYFALQTLDETREWGSLSRFAWPQQSPDRYKTELQPLLEKAIKQQQMPGFAIAVVESNHVAYAHGSGFTNLDHKTGEDARVTPLSLFHMASITKPFVATSIMQLVEAGKLDLDAPVVKYLPYFQMADDRYKTLTLRRWLPTHRECRTWMTTNGISLNMTTALLSGMSEVCVPFNWNSLREQSSSTAIWPSRFLGM